MRCVTALVTPSAAAISSTARCRLWPMVGGASNRTTPSGGGQERGLVGAVGDPVEVPPDPSATVGRQDRPADWGGGVAGQEGNHGGDRLGRDRVGRHLGREDGSVRRGSSSCGATRAALHAP